MKIQQLQMGHGCSQEYTGLATRDNAALDLTGAKLYFTVKQSISDADNAAIFQKSSPSTGITITDATGGQFRVVVSPSDTSAVPYVATTYIYDLRVIDASANVFTLNSGTILINPQVTRATS